MAIVGLRSPFRKRQEKDSPMKAAWIPLAVAGLNLLSQRKAQKQANRNRREDQAKFEEMQAAFNELEFTNPYEGVSNPFSDIKHQFAKLENQFS